jgi:hypothetical protein
MMVRAIMGGHISSSLLYSFGFHEESQLFRPTMVPIILGKDAQATETYVDSEAVLEVGFTYTIEVVLPYGSRQCHPLAEGDF